MVAPFVAAKAYAAIQSQAASLAQSAGATGAAEPSGPGFATLLKNAMSDAVQASRNAEVQMKAQAQGKADLVEVVTAVASAQTSLQTVLAVRDQVIAAYQQVMQMAI
jgi:flagellar hook-basal body complex protein FliE